MNEEERGFKNCEEDYLIPLQSKLQEILIQAKDGGMIRGNLIKRLENALVESDFRKQWEVK